MTIYNEFESDSLREKYPDPISFRYVWDLAEIPKDTVRAAGWFGDYKYWAVKGDVMAVIKYCLVHMDRRNPDDVTDEYMERNFISLYAAYYTEIYTAFAVEAVGRMKELFPASVEDGDETD